MLERVDPQPPVTFLARIQHSSHYQGKVRPAAVEQIVTEPLLLAPRMSLSGRQRRWSAPIEPWGSVSVPKLNKLHKVTQPSHSSGFFQNFCFVSKHQAFI